jgi:4'-phosphopantetheinyl transferase
MAGAGWLTRSPAEVPASDVWLGEREREALAGLAPGPRRADWRLGRFTAKAAVAALTGTAPERVEVMAAGDGAPEVIVDGRPSGMRLSLSHRAGRALAVVAEAGAPLGCDLELVEPRSRAFMDDWLSSRERALVDGAAPADRARLANLAWTAKEAAAKVRREGLRLDLRDAVATLSGAPAPVDGAWRELRVRWEPDGPVATGWWREEPRWVFSVACAEPMPPPERLDAS